nr:helix-turn-helix transcriptional regulator [Rhizobium halophytocola]
MSSDQFFTDASDDTLGGRLSSARDAAGVSLSALANQLGVKRDTLQAWETDRSEPRPSRLVNLAGILGVSPMWLMIGRGEGPVMTAEVASMETVEMELARLREMHQDMGRVIQSLEEQIRRVAARGSDLDS